MPEKSSHFKHFLDRSLSHVVRWSSKPQHFHESVVDHSFYVAYFTAILCYFLREIDEPIDETKAIKMALVHDMEEIFSGDILGPFKHHDEEVLTAIRKAGEERISKAFEELPKGLSEEFVSLWKENLRHKTKEALVVKLADDLSLVTKCWEETRVGNEFFRGTYEKHVKKLHELDYPWWQKIKDKVLPPLA